MKKICMLFFITVSLATIGSQGIITPYYELTRPLLTSPAALDLGLCGNVNPALLTYTRTFHSLFTLANTPGDFTGFNQVGFYTALPYLGSGLVTSLLEDDSWVLKLRCSSGYGNKLLSFGLGYEWNTSRAIFSPSDLITAGILFRPFPVFSLGLMGSLNLDFSEQEIAGDLCLRPFNNDFLCLFVDYALQNPAGWSDLLSGDFSAGAAVRMPGVSGIYLTGRYFPTKDYLSVGLKISGGEIGVISQLYYDTAASGSYNTYSVTINTGEENSLEEIVDKNNCYLELDLQGAIAYRKITVPGIPRLKLGHSLLDLLETIRMAGEDSAISGLVINTSGMQASGEILWELRRALADFKAKGKQVVIYLDYAEIAGYHFVSVADMIICDPLGNIILQGYAAGGSFYKNLLEKAGIGYEEFRLYSHKSAGESFARDSMSDASREQYRELISDFYNITQEEICAARGFTGSEYDSLLNDGFFFTSQTAFENGLCDIVGRWDKVQEAITELEGSMKMIVQPSFLKENKRPFEKEWGEPPHIAVIYALGICDMDTGIRARALAPLIESVAFNQAVRAVVLRVDSPGGSALASDLVADAVKICRDHKPVVISQGAVAASGGYWLSMYGDVIIAAPTTVTGSIGVASSWMYNRGLKEALGISTDFVKEGEHSDFGAPFLLPFLGIGLFPDRNLGDEEQERIRENMRFIYQDFISKAAEGREKEPETIEEVAQGRIWSGTRARQLGLVDEIGGLGYAIEVAREMAGIPPGMQVVIDELPELDLATLLAPYLAMVGIDPDRLLPGPQNGSLEAYLAFRLQHNGEALPLLQVDVMDWLPAW